MAHPVSAGTAPPGYRPERRGDRRLLLREDVLDRAEAIGFTDGAPRVAADGAVSGRTDHSIYAVPGHDERVIWKRCQRGGWIASLLGDRYLASIGVTRFRHELALTARAHEAGIPVAQIYGLAVVGRGIFRRVEMLIRLEEGGRDLAAWLADRDLTPESRRQIIGEVADLLRSFHGAGLHHGDLNLKNLWARRKDDRFDVVLLDLDPAPWIRRGAHSADGNLRRLLRSWLRISRHTPLILTLTDRMRFLVRYFAGDRAAIRDFWSRSVTAVTRGEVARGGRQSKTIGAAP